MILSTKGRYAVIAVIEISENLTNKPISAANISSKHEISISYLEQILSKLKKSGIVSSIKGPGGGYVLAQDKSLITIASIISSIDEPIKITNCGGDKRGCKKTNVKCKTHDLWHGLERNIHSYLGSVSMKDFENQINLN